MIIINNICSHWKRFMWYYHNDPVQKCNKYKNEGCSHVDGMICDYPYCDMMQAYNKAHEK